MTYSPKVHDPIPQLTPELQEIYTKARAMIADPAHHTQEVYARDKYGDRVSPESPAAWSFCAYGALLHVLGLPEPEVNIEVSDAARLPLLRAFEIAMDDDRDAGRGIIKVNDGRMATANLPARWHSLTPHQRILAAYDMVLEAPDAVEV